MDLNYLKLYHDMLFKDVIPFWEKHSLDNDCGGYFTCINQDGSIYDTDKFQWLQLRQIWTFAMLYNQYDQNQKWLDIAKHGADFQMKYGRDSNADWYFSLNRQGEPLVVAYNIFTDAFATMAFAQLSKATGKEEYADIAVATFKRILERQEHPKGKYEKRTTNRLLKNFTLPMILSNLCLELDGLLDATFVDSVIDTSIEEVMVNFYDEASGLTLENKNKDGSLSNTFDGRLVNPGHAIEAMWFMMDIGHRGEDQQLIEKAKDRLLFMLEYGWDKEYGGIYYFKDRLGFPMQQLEHDQKLWWVHLESIEALLKAYAYTNDQRCWEWFEKVHAYAWSHFSDPKHGEWFGYLNRRGEVLSSLKGGKWKGCFHVPRALFHSWKVLQNVNY